MRFTPEIITNLEPNEVFTFGSNLRGAHGAGAALLAANKFGAKRGVGEGLSGQSYAFPTKDRQIHSLPLCDIQTSVEVFFDVCRANPDRTFLLTKVGTGLAGFAIEEIANVFRDVRLASGCPTNIVWPKEFYDTVFV